VRKGVHDVTERQSAPQNSVGGCRNVGILCSAKQHDS